MTETVSLKVRVQKFGTFLSNMIMPNIPALIAWGFITSLFLTPGGWIVSIWPATKPFTTEIANVIGPMLTYMIPLLIAYTGGKNVYGGDRGGVVGAIAAFGSFVAAAVGPGIPMILGAMAMGPLGGWCQKKFDNWVTPHIKTGLEMLVNNFSAGFMGLFLAIISYKVVEPFVTFFTNIAHDGVQALINAHLIPLANLFIEPAKILFLNNAINHGILTPLGLEQVKTAGKSILFLLEANPGPGLGILLAFWVFGKGSAKSTAPGAIIIQFIGGIHEIYFPYVMMKPALFLAVMAGGVTGTFTNNILNTGLVAPAAPGSIIAIALQGTAPAAGGIMNFVKIAIAVAAAAAVSFLVAAFILKNDKSLVDDSQLAEAQATVAGAKAVAKGQAAPVASGDFTAVKHVIFACDAGMGSSAMGASILRDKVKKAGLTQDVTNVAIANLAAGADTIVVTQKELAARAADKAPAAIRFQVDNFMASPVYDQVVNQLLSAAKGSVSTADVQTDDEEKTDNFKLDHNLIKIGQKFATKEEAITYCGNLLVDGGYVKPDYVPAMIQRNAELSVYMGNNIAIPHGTDDAKKEVLKTGITIVQVPEGVNFGTENDPQIATILFGIAGLGNEHLDLIQRISIFCSDIENVAKLADAKTVDEIAGYFES